MAMKINLVRPDDLLNLQIEATNLRLDSDNREKPALVVEDPQRPAFLTFTFPPQTIAETAYFEAAIVRPPTDPNQPKAITPESDPDRPDPEATKTTGETPAPPGQVKARIGHPSRLVFKVPNTTRVPFSVEGLLDWSKLELSLNPIAAIGPSPTQDEIAKAPDIKQPSPLETALELPYRLLISPNRDVAWAHRARPFTARGRTELWHTRLQLKTAEGPVELSRNNRAPLRAIWSPDYNPNERPDPFEKDPDLGRTAMSGDDRWQIVILTSAFHGYEVNLDLGLIPQLINPVIDPVIINPELNPVSGIFTPGRIATTAQAAKLKITVPYVPLPFEAEQLILSPLGGWLRSRGYWNPPRTAKPPRGLVRPDFIKIFSNLQVTRPRGGNPAANVVTSINSAVLLPGIFARKQEQLDLSEWVHIASQGRDHYVRIVYEGELWPYRHPAALIKITERKFVESNGIVCAYLKQRMFIVVRDPVRVFPADERATTFKRVRLTTLVTPEIADPEKSKVEGTNRSFWVKVMTSATTSRLFQFHGVNTDVAGDPNDFTMPMMFVSISDLPEVAPAAAKKVMMDYNHINNISLRDVVIPGQKVTFAARDSDPAKRNDNTQLVTQKINFVVDAFGNPPRMLKAEVKIPQVQELLGADALTTIRYFKDYVDKGFDAATGVFAEVAKLNPSLYKAEDPFAGMEADKLGINFSSDKAGGFATPNMGVSTLTRSLGPLAGKVEDALVNKFDPAEFFKGVTAKLFGSFNLFELLEAVTLDQNAPKMRASTRDVPGGKLVVVTLEWEPQVKNLDLGVAAFEKDYKNVASKLRIDGIIEKPVKLDNIGLPPAAGVTFNFNGKLNNFRVSVLKSVFINFIEFSFNLRANQKPDVKVNLDPAMPVEFAGDLKFVEELRKAIPPGLFGDGPSLDLLTNPPGIRAGFAFALPPISVGVFSLKDVSLGAALTLPFLDGKPVFDFNVSERAHPFLLSVAIFGGGGFFHLQLDTAGIKQLEAAFEFGATAALDLGVASGEVHIMAGIYFAMQRKENSTELAAILSGYLRMGGSLSVLGIVKISVEFVLSFTYDGVRDKAYGRATLTVHVEIAFFSVSVELTVERAFGGKSGDPKFGELFNTEESWSEYALAFA